MAVASGTAAGVGRLPWVLWRVGRLVLHVLHGMAVMALRFPALDAAGRQARIQWWSAGLLRAVGGRFSAKYGAHSVTWRVLWVRWI